MELTDKQIDLLNRRNIVVLASSDLRGSPRMALVEINRAEDNQIIITDNEMIATKNNLLENKKVSLLAFEEDYSYCLKILGEAAYYDKGEYFDFVKNLETNKDKNPKGAVVITFQQVIEFK